MTAMRVTEPLPALGEAARVMLLPATVRSPLAARDFARDMLGQWRLPVNCDVLLIVNELVTNAVVHAVGTVTLTLDLRDDAIRIMVADDTTDGPTCRERDTAAEEGRGLAIVAALSRTWGVQQRAGAKTVWAEVATASSS